MAILMRAVDVAVDTLFPIFCLGCQKEGVWLCEICFGRIDTSGVWLCPVCHRFSAQGFCCPGCVSASGLTQVAAVAHYHEQRLIGRLIHTVKYAYAASAAPCFTALFAAWNRQAEAVFAVVDCMVPVPLHPRRLAERGFNQAEYIVRAAAFGRSLPMVEALRRVKNTRHQTELRRSERRLNVADAFVAPDPPMVAGQRILLVDDVYTTGSTMQACAKALSFAGAASVSGLVLARG